MRKTYVYSKARRKRKKRRFMLCVFLVVLASVIFLKIFELKKFTVTGGSRYSEQEIKEILVTKPTDRISLFFWLRMYLFGGNSLCRESGDQSLWAGRS